MALVSQGFVLVHTYRDTSGSSSPIETPLQGADYATATANAATVLAVWGAMTDAVLGGYAVKEVFEEDALVLPANAENVIKAQLTMQLKDTTDTARVKIPAPTIGIFGATTGAGYNQVPISTAVTNLVNLYVDGNQATISNGRNTIAPPQGYIGGKRISRGSTNP